MALLHRIDRVRPFRPRATAAPRVGRFLAGGVSSRRPQRVPKAAPCASVCLAGTDVRGVLALIAQREKLRLPDEDAFARAWRLVVDTNPFPATTGRICPHRCEERCNRQSKDGAVSVGAIERFLGDFGIARALALPNEAGGIRHAERVAIIGAGPAGLSCAYQLARRGYATTLFESMPEPGGMFRYGIPPYRLPAAVVEAEIGRILALGIELRTHTRIGRDVSLEALRRSFAAVFVAPGAGASRQAMPGVEGDGVHQGVDFLRDVARGVPPALGANVVVVGGGKTAIDVARTCVRMHDGRGSVTLLRRRNPDLCGELEEAMEEGVRVELRGTIAAVVRDGAGRMQRVLIERLDLDAKDADGRSVLRTLPGSGFEVPADTVIVALGQKPNMATLMPGDATCLEADAGGKTRLARVWRGGDAVTPSLAAMVITQGRQVALAIDAELRGARPTEPAKLPELWPKRLRLDWYAPRPRLPRRLAPAEERIRNLHTEIELGHEAAAIQAEAGRCLSCGSCFGCENCWMYCTPGSMKRLPDASPGNYFSIGLETCDGCNKCVEQCPSGVLDMV